MDWRAMGDRRLGHRAGAGVCGPRVVGAAPRCVRGRAMGLARERPLVRRLASNTRLRGLRRDGTDYHRRRACRDHLRAGLQPSWETKSLVDCDLRTTLAVRDRDSLRANDRLLAWSVVSEQRGTPAQGAAAPLCAT